MDQIVSLLHNPALWKLLGGYCVFMAATDAMPQPGDKSSGFYKFAFAFFHGLSMNLKRAASAFKVPGAE